MSDEIGLHSYNASARTSLIFSGALLIAVLIGDSNIPGLNTVREKSPLLIDFVLALGASIAMLSTFVEWRASLQAEYNKKRSNYAGILNLIQENSEKLKDQIGSSYGLEKVGKDVNEILKYAKEINLNLDEPKLVSATKIENRIREVLQSDETIQAQRNNLSELKAGPIAVSRAMDEANAYMDSLSSKDIKAYKEWGGELRDLHKRMVSQAEQGAEEAAQMGFQHFEDILDTQLALAAERLHEDYDTDLETYSTKIKSELSELRRTLSQSLTKLETAGKDLSAIEKTQSDFRAKINSIRSFDYARYFGMKLYLPLAFYLLAMLHFLGLYFPSIAFFPHMESIARWILA